MGLVTCMSFFVSALNTSIHQPPLPQLGLPCHSTLQPGLAWCLLLCLQSTLGAPLPVCLTAAPETHPAGEEVLGRISRSCMKI